MVSRVVWTGSLGLVSPDFVLFGGGAFWTPCIVLAVRTVIILSL